MAGKDWFYAFKKRNPNISLRRPESTSINRITAFNETEVKMFFNNLESLQTKYQFDANRIYNVDETGISNVQRNSRILASKGQKQVGMISSGEKGTTITVVCAFSASGNYIPPFFIFKRKRMNAQLLHGGNSDMIAAVSDLDWINENLFVDWLHHFISNAKPSVEKPILLVLDNHESHVSLACYLLCRKNGIINTVISSTAYVTSNATSGFNILWTPQDCI
ncbi:MFS-type transporter clz9-like [Melitaea cinxia]|uniref:MFS-type transporter clz9-like n=1 Tax=Melitaea cinxia TaxID=113334 RepID=UPI001E26EA32|nr:MFS-type transporter clz9-like [Melitaea cinxia]